MKKSKRKLGKSKRKMGKSKRKIGKKSKRKIGKKIRLDGVKTNDELYNLIKIKTNNLYNLLYLESYDDFKKKISLKELN